MTANLRPALREAYQIWFQGISATQRSPPEAVAKRWWGINRSAEERSQFDQQCRNKFGSTLESISSTPIKTDADADQYAQSLMKECPDGDAKEQYEGVLGLILLLDQMTRHIYRDESAKNVYSYYDKIAVAVATRAIDSKIDSLRNKDVLTFRQWFYMPMQHSENIKHQNIYFTLVDEMEGLLKNTDDEAGIGYLNQSRVFGEKHRDIIKRFGRFPHRNSCLKREPTKEEEKWLAEGGDSFGTA